MPTLFSKWNGKGGLKPIAGSRYGRGISSTDLSPGSEDANELPDLLQVSSNVDLHDDDPSSWRLAQSQHIQGTSLSEFGVSPSVVPSQRANNGHHNRYGTEPRMLAPKGSSKGLTKSLSTIRQPTKPEAIPSMPAHPPTYGYTTIGWDAQMDVARAVEVVLACGEQIRARGE